MRFRRASAGGKFYESEEQLLSELKKEGTSGPAYDLLLSVALCHDAIAVASNDEKQHKTEKKPRSPAPYERDSILNCHGHAFTV